MMDLPLEKVYLPESLEIMMKMYQEEVSLDKTVIKSQPTSRLLELQVCNRDGSIEWTEANVTFLRDRNGDISEIVGITRKITDRKKTEQENKVFSSAVDGAADAIIITDINGIITYSNPSAEEMYGYKKGEMLGESVINLNTNLKMSNEIMSAMLKTGSWHGEIESIKKNKESFPALLSLSTVKDENGNLIAMMGTVRDITQRKIEEENIKGFYHGERELRKSLQDEMRRRVDFTRALVHELKTPVTAMMASIQLLAEEAPEGPLLRLAKNIEESVIRLNKRISELLDIARGELGILKYSQKKVNVMRMLQDIETEMSIAISNNQQSLVFELPPAIPTVMGDEERLREVIINLLGNAAKYTLQGGKITLRAREHNYSLIVEVEDTGSGIDKKDIDRIFEPYYRAENQSGTLTGLGLGLAICKRTVEHHGGKVWVSSQKGKGSTFGFSIPLTADVG